MDFEPKTTEELLVYAAIIAVIALWRAFAKEKDRCEKNNSDMKLEMAALHSTLHTTAAEASRRGEERERLLSVMVQQTTQAMKDQREVTIRAVRLLRRYDPDPDVSFAPRPDDHEIVLPPREAPARDDETSALFRDPPVRRVR